MSVPASTLESTVTSESALQKERERFRELRARLSDAILNRVFDLRPAMAAQRMQYFIFLFLLSGFLITLTHESYSLRFWAQHVQSVFLYLFNPAYAAGYEGNAITDFAVFVFNAFTDPETLQYLPIFLAPFFIAIQTAARYLADIFELENVGVARAFIWEVALTGSDETIRIQQGDIAEKHRDSSNYLIGGPGKVVVDLDSVALFEKPDGTPHIIGPTGKEPGGRATLEGFERFRQAIDIRDHYVDLRDQDPKSQSVRGRSRDGLPISATDVRLMFSVYRGENPRTSLQYPYPFSSEAVEKIVYRSVSRVTPEAVNPSAYEFSWINNMIGLIRGKLGGFMSEYNLSVYLASTGMPEFEKAKQREQLISEQVRRLSQQVDDPAPMNEIKPPPEFTPRYKITNLFSQFADEFTASARNNGVELHWIGVGTWKTPPELDIVPEKHLEAWKLSQENIRNGGDEALKKVEHEAILQKMETLISNVPLGVYEEILDSGKKFGKKDTRKKPTTLAKKSPTSSEEGMDDMLSSLMLLSAMQGKKSYSSYDSSDISHEDAMKLLLLEYRKQLLEAVDFMKARNETVPPKIEEAIRLIDEQGGWAQVHWIGGE
jgi:hypothetical protein